MAKREHVKTIVVGGKKDLPQQYCGVVGGQSTDFSSVDTEIKAGSSLLRRMLLLTNGLVNETEEPYVGSA